MGERLWIPRRVFSRMVANATQWAPYETGGMLLGYEADNGEAVVTEVIGPGPTARHGRFRFKPDADFQQAELETHYLKTNGRETYLGDWHTHPAGNATPSLLDKRTLARIACTPSSGTAKPIMAILSKEHGSWVPGAVRFERIERKFFLNSYLLASLSPFIHDDTP